MNNNWIDGNNSPAKISSSLSSLRIILSEEFVVVYKKNVMNINVIVSNMLSKKLWKGEK